MRRLLTALALGSAVGGSPLAAQNDFMNLDPGHPLRVEDAYPIKFMEWEWQAGLSGGFAESETGVGLPLELKVGAFRNAQLGAEIHAGWERHDGQSGAGLEAAVLHALYNLNQEGRTSPALAFRVDVATPGAGDVGQEQWATEAKALLTKTVGSSRVHLNGGYQWSAEADGGATWVAVLAIDRALGLSSRLVLFDAVVEVPEEGVTRWWFEGGTRMQISRTTVLDAGLTARMDRWFDGEANLGLTIGISRSFGFSGLVSVPPYPNPAIR